MSKVLLWLYEQLQLDVTNVLDAAALPLFVVICSLLHIIFCVFAYETSAGVLTNCN